MEEYGAVVYIVLLLVSMAVGYGFLALVFGFLSLVGLRLLNDLTSIKDIGNGAISGDGSTVNSNSDSTAPPGRKRGALELIGDKVLEFSQHTSLVIAKAVFRMFSNTMEIQEQNKREDDIELSLSDRLKIPIYHAITTAKSDNDYNREYITNLVTSDPACLINRHERLGATPLLYAMLKGRNPVVKLLFDVASKYQIASNGSVVPAYNSESNSTLTSQGSESVASTTILDSTVASSLDPSSAEEQILKTCSLRDEIVCQEYFLQSMAIMSKLSAFHGENALHIAIAKKDLGLVRYLVRDGNFSEEATRKLINGRATGTFFAPGVETHDKSGAEVVRLTRMARSDDRLYLGETPIAFAVCTNQMDMVDFLLEYGAKLSEVDSYGNTLFHLCVVHEHIAMLEHLFTKLKPGYRCDILNATTDGLGEFYPLEYKNKDGFTPLQLAASLGMYNMFDHILKKGRILRWEYASLRSWSYPLDNLLFSTHDGKRTGAVKLIVEKYHIQLLRHPVVGAILDKRWENEFRTRFMVNLLIVVVGIVSLTITSLISVNNRSCASIVPPVPAHLLSTFNLGNEFQDSQTCTFPDWLWCNFFRVVVIILCYGKLRIEIVEMRSRGLRLYFSGSFPQIFENATSSCACVFSLSSLAVMAVPIPFVYAPGVVALALLTAYAYSLFYLLGFSRTGPFIIMISRMFFEDVFVFSLVFIVFLLSFASAGYVLRAGADAAAVATDPMQGMQQAFEFVMSKVAQSSDGVSATNQYFYYADNSDDRKGGHTFGHELEETFESMFGNFDLSWYDFSMSAKALHVLYVIMTTVLLFNTLIAKMSKTFEAIQQNAVLVWKIERARIMDSLESEDSENEQKSMSYWVAAGKDNEKRYFVEVSEDSEKYYSQEQSSVNNSSSESNDDGSGVSSLHAPIENLRQLVQQQQKQMQQLVAGQQQLVQQTQQQQPLSNPLMVYDGASASFATNQPTILDASNVSNASNEIPMEKLLPITYAPSPTTLASTIVSGPGQLPPSGGRGHAHRHSTFSATSNGHEAPEFDVDSPSGMVSAIANAASASSPAPPSKRSLFRKRISLLGRSSKFFSKKSDGSS